MKSSVVPIPIDSDIAEMIARSAKETGLKKADIMRQGLRFGVPALTQKLAVAAVRRRPKCLDFLDDYPRPSVAAKDVKKALKEKMAKKYGRGNR